MSRNPNPAQPSRQPVPPRRAPIPVINIPAARAPAAASPAHAASAADIPAGPAPRTYEPAIVARAGTYYRATRYIMVLVLVVCGGLFAYDGWRGWPAEAAKFDQLRHELDELEQLKSKPDKLTEYDQKSVEIRKYKHRSALDIRVQKALGISLPIAAFLLLLWMLRNSRGAYRLNNQTLEVPGHPPVPLEQITKLDETLWDRKGIAFVEYQTPVFRGRMRLDDFIYQRDPTDAIYEKIKQHMAGRQQA
jgi:hypothetical protein